jgi:hypothetical protein
MSSVHHTYSGSVPALCEFDGQAKEFVEHLSVDRKPVIFQILQKRIRVSQPALLFAHCLREGLHATQGLAARRLLIIAGVFMRRSEHVRIARKFMYALETPSQCHT